MTNEKYVDLSLREALCGYFDDRREVIAVYLFGSYVRARLTPMSDVDVAILHDPEICIGDTVVLKIEYMKGLERIFHRDVDVVLLREAGLFLRYQIFSKGTRVYERERRKSRDFQAFSLGEYFDFRFQKKVYYEKMLQRMKGHLLGR